MKEVRVMIRRPVIRNKQLVRQHLGPIIQAMDAAVMEQKIQCDVRKNSDSQSASVAVVGNRNMKSKVYP